MIVAAFIGAAAVGALVRWKAAALNRPSIPLGTLAVNLIASFAAGLLADLSSTATLIVVTAFLGSTSTFSTVMGEVYDRRDRSSVAAAYLAVTVVGGVAAAWLGLAL